MSGSWPVQNRWWLAARFVASARSTYRSLDRARCGPFAAPWHLVMQFWQDQSIPLKWTSIISEVAQVLLWRTSWFRGEQCSCGPTLLVSVPSFSPCFSLSLLWYIFLQLWWRSLFISFGAFLLNHFFVFNFIVTHFSAFVRLFDDN